MRSAASSSVVTTTTRTAMSIRASDGMLADNRWPFAVAFNGQRRTVYGERLTDFADEREHGHVHGDGDTADGHAQERDEQRFEKFHQTGHRDVDFVLIEVGDFRKHRIERAGLLTDGG